MGPLAGTRDPLRLGRLLWPHVNLFREQRDVVRSVQENDETLVPAGNQLGKDFVSGYIAVCFFLRPQMFFSEEYVRYVQLQEVKDGDSSLVHTRRIITTSVKDDHLRILWGEISRFVRTSDVPLPAKQGGPFTMLHHEIRLAIERDISNPVNYLRGMVSETGEGMSGHHAAYTLCIIDEASGVDEEVYKYAQGWTKKFLIIGNPNPGSTFFERLVKEGDKAAI